MPGVLVFLPTYNEKENIASMVRDVLATAPEIEALVVDDNSPDGTAGIVQDIVAVEPRVHLMLRAENRGRGFAEADAIAWFQKKDYDVFVEMDADGSHPPKYIPDLLKAIGSGAGVAICSRLVPGGGERNRSFIRRWLTYASNLYIRIILGLRQRDCTTGYRAFSREALSAVEPEKLFTPGPAIVQELLYVVAQRGFRIVEIPFMFEQRVAGVSKLNIATLALSISNVLKIRKVHKNTK